jgi:hypothetical protein
MNIPVQNFTLGVIINEDQILILKENCRCIDDFIVTELYSNSKFNRQLHNLRNQIA